MPRKSFDIVVALNKAGFQNDGACNHKCDVQPVWCMSDGSDALYTYTHTYTELGHVIISVCAACNGAMSDWVQTHVYIHTYIHTQIGACNHKCVCSLYGACTDGSDAYIHHSSLNHPGFAGILPVILSLSRHPARFT